MRRLTSVLLGCCCGLLLAADQPAPAYFNDFEKTQIGKPPEDIMSLDGTFAVREVDGNKCLELGPDPIGSFGALFGPEGSVAMDVKARIWAAATGRRFPEIGIGADDAGGYKLFVIPARHALELRKGEDAVTSVPFEWTSGSWTCLRLRVEPKDGAWLIQAKAWPQNEKEPESWNIVTKDTEAPTAGKASIWGSDFSEQPIRFDDLGMTPIGR